MHPCGRWVASVRTCHVRTGLLPHGLTCASARIHSYPRGRECFTPGNFITNATVRPSHGRPSGYRPTVRPFAIVCVTTLV
jgi:hypothetical protein